MTHNELRLHKSNGVVNRISLHQLTANKWIVISEKPDDMAQQVFDSETEAKQVFCGIKMERGL